MFFRFFADYVHKYLIGAFRQLPNKEFQRQLSLYKKKRHKSGNGRFKEVLKSTKSENEETGTQSGGGLTTGRDAFKPCPGFHPFSRTAHITLYKQMRGTRGAGASERLRKHKIKGSSTE